MLVAEMALNNEPTNAHMLDPPVAFGFLNTNSTLRFYLTNKTIAYL
jgi:hypothetical protein